MNVAGIELVGKHVRIAQTILIHGTEHGPAGPEAFVALRRSDIGYPQSESRRYDQSRIAWASTLIERARTSLEEAGSPNGAAETDEAHRGAASTDASKGRT